jgi:hypothetical protein
VMPFQPGVNEVRILTDQTLSQTEITITHKL